MLASGSAGQGRQLIAAGHNERVQRGDPVAHGEIACLRNAGRRPSYLDTALYTTLSPCQMCTGAILLFQIPRVVVGEAETFAGDLAFLADRGVEIVLLEDEAAWPPCTSSSAATPRSGAKTSAAANPPRQPRPRRRSGTAVHHPAPQYGRAPWAVACGFSG